MTDRFICDIQSTDLEEMDRMIEAHVFTKWLYYHDMDLYKINRSDNFIAMRR